MAIKVIGAGFPRTGSASLKLALNQLGLGPCYHMSEVFTHPEHWQPWLDAAEGRPVDWDVLFADYHATADAPGCHFYHQLAAHYPAAKIVLTMRDPESWFASTQATVLSDMLAEPRKARPELQLRMLTAIGWNGASPETHEKEAMLRRYNTHNEEVVRTIEPSRLLVWQPSEGWPLLCEFLGVPVPDVPYPHVNTTAAFREMIAAGAGANPQRIREAFIDQASRGNRAKD